ncbi:MAG: hypothetical protein ACLGIG_05015 [Actinomycetes bacterium]
MSSTPGDDDARSTVMHAKDGAARGFRAVTLELPDFDPRLRERRDDDPVVEEMVERLRRGLGGLVAVDPWGRPIAWRDVVRTALGTALFELRDARAAAALAQAVEARSTVGSPNLEPFERELRDGPSAQ